MATDLVRLPDRGLGGRRKRRPERHDQILVAAVDRFAELGFHGTAIEDVAAAVGVSPAAVYRHFRTKQEILDTAALWISDQLVEALNVALHDDAAPLERLERAVGTLVDSALTMPQFVTVLVHELQSVSPEVRHSCMETRAGYVEVWCDLVRAARPSLTRDDALLRIHLVFSLICSVPAYRRRRGRRTATRDTVLQISMAALVGDGSTTAEDTVRDRSLHGGDDRCE